MTSIFVYGTLKRGGSNHPFLAGQAFVAAARTLPGFRLYDLGGYPGLVTDRTATHSIEGEVWHVDDGCLAQLDQLEGVDEGLYRRESIPLAPPFAQEKIAGYLYARDVTGRTDLGSSWLGQ